MEFKKNNPRILNLTACKSIFLRWDIHTIYIVRTFVLIFIVLFATFRPLYAQAFCRSYTLEFCTEKCISFTEVVFSSSTYNAQLIKALVEVMKWLDTKKFWIQYQAIAELNKSWSVELLKGNIWNWHIQILHIKWN